MIAADGHDRPGHGLRHDGHRARLRARSSSRSWPAAVTSRSSTAAVPAALRTLGYSEMEIAEIEAYATGHGNLNQAPGVNPTTLRAKGFGDEQIEAVNGALASAFDIKFAFNKWTLGAAFCHDVLGLTDEQLDDFQFDLLAAIGFPKKEIEGRQHPRVRGDDAGGRAAPEGRAPARVRLRQSVRQDRQALPVGREPHPHDGRRPALHLGAPSPRPSTCPTTRPWRTARAPTCSRGSWR